VREGNPTQERLESALATLESGAVALAFASGMAAMTALLDSLPGGSHALFPEDCYTGLRVLAAEFLPQRGVNASMVDTGNIDAVRAAITPQTRCLWLETPSNPQLRISDIAALCDLAHEHGIFVACDNTFATPLLQQPLRLGADVVMHSTTKYFGGHSDVLGGALVFTRRDALFEAVAHRRHITGGVPSPFNVWLTLRGLRSLPARMAWHCGNARVVAQFLSAHPRVRRRAVPERAPTRGSRAVARLAVASESRRRGTPDARFWRHAQRAHSRRSRRGTRHGRQGEIVYECHFAWRLRIADRTPRVGRRRTSGLAGKPVAAIGGARTSG